MTTLEDSIADVDHKEAKKIKYKSCGMELLQLQELPVCESWGVSGKRKKRNGKKTMGMKQR